MIEVRVIRDEDVAAYHTKVEIDGTLTVLTLELAHIVRTIYQHIAKKNAEDAAAMKMALLGAMTHPDLDFWALPTDSTPEDQEAVQS